MRVWCSAMRVGAVGVLAALALTGCNGGGPGPSSSPTPGGTYSASSSATPSASTSPSPTSHVPVPEDAKPNTPEGATAFARWYLEQASQAAVDWDTGVIDTYANSTCTVCVRLSQDLQQWKSEGLRNPSRRFQFTASQVGPGEQSSTYTVDILGQDNASQIIDNSGKVVKEQLASDVRLRVNLVAADPWKVVQIVGIVQ